MAEGFTHVESKANVLCRYFIHGACRLGDNCTFSHDNQEGSQLSSACRFYQKGNCTYGEKCRYDHIRPEKLQEMRKDQNCVNKSKKDSKPMAPTILSSKSNDKTSDKEQCRLTPLNTTFSKLCPDAPEFVPRFSYSPPSNSTTESISYAVAAGASSEASDPKEKYVSKIMKQKHIHELCPFFLFSGQCRLREACTYIHGNLCEFCQMNCLHPTDAEQQKSHMEECMKDMEEEMEHSFAIARSKEQQCGICMETVWERNLSTQQRFGILPNCSHCYCLDCIRKWRQSKQFDNKIVRSCPECRTQSDYIIPSRYWVDDKDKADKQKLLEDYKAALGAKACKYFKQGKGECPFGNKCFYLHALVDGTVKDVGPPKKKTPVTNSEELQTYLHNMILWEFLESREERIENIQSSIQSLLEDFEAHEILDLIRTDDISWSDQESD